MRGGKGYRWLRAVSQELHTYVATLLSVQLGTFGVGANGKNALAEISHLLSVA